MTSTHLDYAQPNRIPILLIGWIHAYIRPSEEEDQKAQPLVFYDSIELHP